MLLLIDCVMKQEVFVPEIIFNAFSFLQPKLRKANRPYTHVTLTIPEIFSAMDLIHFMDLDPSDVEVVFVNGRVVQKDTLLKDSDRVAFVPYGTPGPYRVLLGFKNKQLQS